VQKSSAPRERRGTTFDATDELLDQLTIPMRTDFSAQPQPGRDLERHPHPDDRALHLDAQFIAWYLPPWPGSLDHLRVHLLRVLPASLQPAFDRALIEREGRDNRLHRATVSEQRHDQRDDIGGFPQAVKDRPRSGAEGLLALAADEAAFLLGMHPDVALTGLASGRTVEVGAKCLFWGQRRLCFLIGHKEIVA